MSVSTNKMRFICPILAVLATVIALFGQWFTRTTSITRNTLESTLLEVIQGQSFVEYSSSRWLWISGAGVLLVVFSGLVNEQLRKNMAEAGSYLMVILPAWSLFQVYVGEEDFDAGWAIWITFVISVAVIILAKMMPKYQEVEPVILERPVE